jgi:hypothetical protein
MSGDPKYLSHAGAPSMAARCEGKMRKALVTLSGAGLLASLLFSSCIVKEKDGGDATGGTTGMSSGGTVSIRGGADSGNVGGSGPTTTAQCPGLLDTFGQSASGVCSTSKQAAEFSQINMLIVLDKSGSMTSTPPGYSKSKWDGAVASLKTALKPTETLVHYGFMLYPYLAAGEVTNCELADGALAVNIGVGLAADTVPAINELMANTTPKGGTPTASALSAALEYYTAGAGMNLVGAKYVLLVTDGGPNCNDNVICGPETCTANMDKSLSCGTGVYNCCDISMAVAGRPNPQSLCLDDKAVLDQINALSSEDIKTFVVGIPGTEAYAAYLDTFAEAGGVPVTDPSKAHKYYEVTGESGLVQAFTAITTSLVRSCTVPLEKAPMDLNNINLAIDCNPVPQKTGDAFNWQYVADQQAIVIEGSQCTRIESTGVNRVDVVLGCPPYNPI